MPPYVTRSQWGASPPESPLTPWNPASLFGVGVHWFGIPDGSADHTLCDNIMRGVQNGHQAGEFVDIAYNHCVCTHGYVFEARGWDYRTGANGYADVNKKFAAVCVMLGRNNLPSMFTPAAQAATKWVIGEWRRRGAGLTVQRHGYWTGSECPGPTVGAWVDLKGYEIGDEPVTDIIPDWLDDWLYWRLVQDADPAKRPASVPVTIPQEAWDFATMAHRLATHFGMSEGEEQWISWKRAGSDPSTRPQVPTTIPQRWWDDLAFVNSEAGL